MGIPVLVAIFFAVFWAIALYQFAKTWQYFAKRLILSYLVIAYIAYESVTKTAVNVLVCVRADISCDRSASSRYWAVDTSVECNEGSHSVLVGTLGWPVVLLFTLGFPVGLAFALVFIRRYAPERDVWYNEATGFLYRAYDDRFFFWESMIMLRKSLLAVIVAFGYSLGPNIQGVLAISVLTAALYFHTLFRPFDKAFDQLNAYESASLVVSQLTFISGLLLSDDRVSEEVHVLLSTFLIISVGGLSFFFLLTFCNTFVSYARIQFRLDGLEDVESWSHARVLFSFLALRVQKHLRFLSNDRVQRRESDSNRPSSAD